jgi:uncharacterized membrane protein
MSFEFYFFLKANKVPTYARLLERVVSHQYAFGEGSGMQVLRPYWNAMPETNKILLGVHTTLAAVSLTIGPVQFLRGVRRRHPELHRLLGKIYVSLGLISMMAAVGYLILTPFEKTYGGAPFAIGLWGIAVLSTYSFIAGIVHAMRGEMWQHRALMTLNFCALLIAPLLRIGWLSLGAMFPKLSQMQVHTAVLMFIGIFAVFSAIVVTNTGRPKVDGEPRTDGSFGNIGRIILRLRWPILFASITAGISSLGLSYMRLRSPELWSFLTITGEPIEVTRAIFADKSWPFALLGFAGLIALTLAPILLFFDGFFGRMKAGKERTYLYRFIQAAFLVSSMLAAAAHMFRANLFGTDWVRGWGGSFFEATIGTLLFICSCIALTMLARRDHRGAREFYIHMFGLLLIPASHYLSSKIFIEAGFSFEDAYLSAAALVSSLHLSQSYHYTVYGPVKRGELGSPESAFNIISPRTPKTHRVLSSLRSSSS